MFFLQIFESSTCIWKYFNSAIIQVSKFPPKYFLFPQLSSASLFSGEKCAVHPIPVLPTTNPKFQKSRKKYSSYFSEICFTANPPFLTQLWNMCHIFHIQKSRRPQGFCTIHVNFNILQFIQTSRGEVWGKLSYVIYGWPLIISWFDKTLLP